MPDGKKIYKINITILYINCTVCVLCVINCLVSSKFLYLMVLSRLILCRHLHLSNLAPFVIILDHKMASCKVNITSSTVKETEESYSI